MKKMLYAAVVAGLMLTSMPTVCVVSALKDRIARIYRGAKNKVSDTHTSLLIDGMMRKAHNKMPSFLKGDNGVDSMARILLLTSALYIGIKPLLKSDTDARKVLLGAMGWIFKFIGVDNLTVQGENYAQIAREKQEELARDVRKAIDEFSGQNVAV